MIFDQINIWRETQRPARFLCFDARIVVFIGLFLVHARIWTLCLMMLAAASLFLMERNGVKPVNAGRHLRSWLAGPVVRARRLDDLRMPGGWLDNQADS